MKVGRHGYLTPWAFARVSASHDHCEVMQNRVRRPGLEECLCRHHLVGGSDGISAVRVHIVGCRKCRERGSVGPFELHTQSIFFVFAQETSHRKTI
jgi:hypothetical protein